MSEKNYIVERKYKLVEHTGHTSTCNDECFFQHPHDCRKIEVEKGVTAYDVCRKNTTIGAEKMMFIDITGE